jgi:hypothetical protein
MDGQLEPKVNAEHWFNETYGGNKWATINKVV